MSYWALCSNPDNYRIEEAVRDPEIDWWVTGRHRILNGDRVLIWRALGRRRRSPGREPWRGIVALGEVVGEAEERSDADNKYNIGNFGQECEKRVPVRYVLPPNLPLRIGGEYNDLLTQLSVYPARGGAHFPVKDEQLWRAVVEAAGGWPHPDQGPGEVTNDPERKRDRPRYQRGMRLTRGQHVR